MTRTALVTGANKGIGFEIAAQLGALGITVLVGARDAGRRETAVEKLRAGGAAARGIALDVTNQSSVDAAAAEIGELDILVNNAGILTFEGSTPGAADLDAVRKVFDTNVFGIIRVTEALLPALRRSPAGRIVNLSSSVGSFAITTDPDNPMGALPPSLGYLPSKTTVTALTVQYAKQLSGTDVLVNAVCPGYCATDLNAHQGFRTPVQGAEIAVKLATVGADGPQGGFFDDEGVVPW
jgi:NAD(P)-dependent dehydrogenase (short-subunit alcohol dehydrogenase family)